MKPKTARRWLKKNAWKLAELRRDRVYNSTSKYAFKCKRILRMAGE